MIYLYVINSRDSESDLSVHWQRKTVSPAMIRDKNFGCCTRKTISKWKKYVSVCIIKRPTKKIKSDVILRVFPSNKIKNICAY